MSEITKKHGKLANPPLVYTLFMLRFPNQLDLDARVADIQSKLKAEYPIYERGKRDVIEFARRSDGQSVTTSSITDHLFFDESRSRGFMVLTDRLVFHACRYPSYEEFKKWVSTVLSVMLPIVEIEHYSNFGIRFLNAIQLNENEDVNKIVNGEFLKFTPRDNSIKLSETHSTQLYDTPAGKLTIMAHYLTKRDTCFPPDLRDSASLLKSETTVYDAPFVVLDIDHTSDIAENEIRPINLDEIFQNVGQMHTFVSIAFLDVVRSSVFKRWKGNDQ